MKNSFPVWRVYYAGDDDYHYFKGFGSEEEAIEKAKSIKESECFGKGSVIVVREETVFIA